MKEIESKRKGKPLPKDVPYPEGVKRRNKVQVVNNPDTSDELEEDRKLLSSGKNSMFTLLSTVHIA